MNINYKENSNLIGTGDVVHLHFRHLFIENTSTNPLSTISVYFGLTKTGSTEGTIILKLRPGEYFDLKDIVTPDKLSMEISYEERIQIVPDTANVTTYKLINYGL